MSSAQLARSARLNVQAKATTKVAKKAVPAKPVATPKATTGLAVLSKIEKLQLLSKVEQAGLLTKLEEAGFTLSKIEKSGLLSTAEKSGLLSFVADKETPGLLNAAGLALLVAAVAIIVLVPDESSASVALQAAGALTLGAGSAAALVGSSILADLQKP